MLERRLSRSFIYILWIHYFCLFFITLFCLNIGEYGFNVKFFDIEGYKLLGFLFLAIRSVAIFFPIGYLARKEPFAKSMAFVVFFVLTIELSQYVFRMGNFDVNEIFFSIIGVCSGYFMSQTKKKKRRRRKSIPSVDVTNQIPTN